MVLGGSAFNIKAKSLRLGDFSEREVRELLAQHTAATGQAFTEEVLCLIVARTAGQPWLMNALCREACFDDQVGRDRSRPITEQAILEAQERLILARVTHLDNLADKLREERVRRVIEPILAGADRHAWTSEDVAYACDLGLVAQEADGTPRIANPIYAEVVPRHLNYAVQTGLPQRMTWYVGADGALDVDGLIASFAAGASAAYRQRGRADRAGIRPGPRPDGPADRVAAGRARAAVRGGVQGAARGAGADRRRGDGAEPVPTWTDAGRRRAT